MKNETIGLILLLCLMIGVTLFMNIIGVWAFPYQLLPNGTLSDVNYSINGTPVDIVLFNDSLYIVQKNLTNYTILNVTNIYQNITQNITYVNMTCLNCSNYYNQTVNTSYFDYGYNSSYVDNNFVKLSDYNSYKSGLNYATLADLNNLNATITKPQEVSTNTTWLWLSVLGLFLLIVCLIGYIGWMSRSSE